MTAIQHVSTNKSIYVQSVLTVITLLFLWMFQSSWAEVKRTVTETHDNLDSLRYTLERANNLTALNTQDIATMRKYVHRHNPNNVEHWNIFPEGQQP